MQFSIKTNDAIPDAPIIFPSSFRDDRGAIWTTFNQELSETIGLTFNHDKFSVSQDNILRGIHGDKYTTKLVTCISGSIRQVVVDLRKGSSTFGNHFTVDIDADTPTLVLIPAGCGNAFFTTKPHTVYHYKLSYSGQYKDHDEQFSVFWNDPDLAIDWGIQKEPLVSDRDREAMSFAEYLR